MQAYLEEELLSIHANRTKIINADGYYYSAGFPVKNAFCFPHPALIIDEKTCQGMLRRIRQMPEPEQKKAKLVIYTLQTNVGGFLIPSN
jgi:hypothetical protein